MHETTITLHSAFEIGPVDERLFGGFMEHMGRCIYGGIYDPRSVWADEDGFRKDVLQALRRLGMTVIRYPGGNFASGYHWMDGVGPRERRPTVRELAWQSIEPNEFGTDEYIKLCRKMGWTPMITVNLGTGTSEEARNWVEYCNCPPGTRYADMRASNGSPEPYGVKLWCLGNEMDGPWQLGHVPAREYAIRAQQAAKMMKDADHSIELVVCGSCGPGMPTYLDWDREVLEYVGDLADYVSIHRYVGNPSGDTADYLAVSHSIDEQIEQTDAVCRYVQARRRSKKRAWICFDEWNVWYKNHEVDGRGMRAPRLIEEIYNLEDALVAAGFLMSFIRHADCVRIANLAQLVNVIAPILTRGDEMLIQSIYYPFEMISKRRAGVSLRAVVSGPCYESKSHGRTMYVDTAAILGDGVLHVFLTNRHLADPMGIVVELTDRQLRALESAELLTGPGPKANNSFDEPDLIVARPFENVELSGGKARFELPPLSFVALSFRL